MSGSVKILCKAAILKRIPVERLLRPDKNRKSIMTMNSDLAGGKHKSLISAPLKTHPHGLFGLGLLFILFLARAGFAAEVVTTFNPPGGPAPDLATYGIGFELLGNGLYWWQGDGVCGELPNNSELGFKGSTSGAVAASRPVLSCDHQISGAGRDDLFFYFAADKRIYSKALTAAPTDPAQELTTAFTPLDSQHDLGAAMFWNGRFYWTDYQDLGSSFDIWSINPDGTGAQLVLSGSGYKVLKMVGYTYTASFLNFTDAIFFLTSDGQLIRLDVNPSAAPVVLATGITDFAIRDESAQAGPFFTFFTEVYATTGQKYNLNGSTPPGTLIKMNATGSSLTTFYTATAQNQLTSVAADSVNLYWTEQPVVCPPPFACSLGDYSIYRQSSPSDNSQAPGPVQLIGLPGGDAGVNLRSDGQWLYFLYGNSIKRFSTQTPPLQLAVQADGLEVVQALQDMNSDVPIVANRTTYVRGYAHLSANNTGKYNWPCAALLHGFRNGIEFSDSPINSLDGALLLTHLDPPTLQQMRDDTGAHTFLFRLPDSWVQSSSSSSESLNFTMTVNADQQIPETGSPPFVHDTISLLKSATLVRGLHPTLNFIPLICTGPSYYAYGTGFNQIIQRVFSMLSAEQLNIRSSDDPQGDWDHPFDFTQTDPDKAQDVFNDAVNKMDDLEQWYDDYAEIDEHFIGMIHPMANTGGQLAGNGNLAGNGLVATMSWTPGRGRTYVGGVNVAHELGHNYGHKHINCGTFTASQQVFDYVEFPCSLGTPDMTVPQATYGFDSLTFQIIPPTAAADTMSYNSSMWSSAAYWYDHFGPQPATTPVTSAFPSSGPQPNGLNEVLLVRGRINPILPAASLNAFYLVSQTVAPAAVVAASRQASDLAASQPNPYYMVFFDAGGNTLSQVALGIQIAGDTTGSNSLRFAQYVDFPDGARTIELVQGTQVLAERFISPSAPSLTLGSPVIDNVAGTLHLDWTASDPDGNPLLFTIQYTADGGTTWRPLRNDYGKLEITISTAWLAGGTQARLRVIATDGVNTTVAVTPPFTISNHPPQPVIAGVAEGQPLTFGGPDTLIGLVLDAQNGSVSNQLTWILSGPTPLTGTTATLPLTGLSPGDYAATLTATDTLGLTGSAVRNFSVLPPTVPEASAAATLDGLANDDGYAQALVIPMRLEDGSVVYTRMFHSGGNLYVSAAGLKFGGGTSRSFGLRVDPAPGGASAPNSNVFGFFVDETGAPREERGNGATMVTTLSPVPGFAAAIYNTGSNSWSAELSVADTLLGGWGHAAGLMLEHGVAHWPPNAVSSSLNSYGGLYLGTNAPQPPASTPFANAGQNRSIPLSTSQTVFLDGSGSFDPQNLPLNYSWTQVSGPAVPLSGTNTPVASFAAAPVTNTTQLVFQLAVNNGVLPSLPSQVQITLLPPLSQPIPPVQAAGVSVGSDGRLQVRFIGQPLMAYQIQASTDLIQWTTISTQYADYAGRIEFEASLRDPNFPIRFFRTYGP